jgi:hypothetical protein
MSQRYSDRSAEYNGAADTLCLINQYDMILLYDRQHSSPAVAQLRSAQDWGQEHADCQAGGSSESQIASLAVLRFLGTWTHLESLSV